MYAKSFHWAAHSHRGSRQGGKDERNPPRRRRIKKTGAKASNQQMSYPQKKKKIGYVGTRNRSFGKERRDYTWQTARERLEGRDKAAGKKREGRQNERGFKNERQEVGHRVSGRAERARRAMSRRERRRENERGSRRLTSAPHPSADWPILPPASGRNRGKAEPRSLTFAAPPLRSSSDPAVALIGPSNRRPPQETMLPRGFFRL